VAEVRAALAKAGTADPVAALATKAATFGGAPAGRGGRGGGGGGGGRGGGGGATDNFTTINGEFGRLMTQVESSDDTPTIGARETYEDACKSLTDALKKWDDLKKTELTTVNGTLGANKIAVPPAVTGAPSCQQ
jgi:hypothetical protein